MSERVKCRGVIPSQDGDRGNAAHTQSHPGRPPFAGIEKNVSGRSPTGLTHTPTQGVA